jgi:hypothetical protein
MVVPTIGLPADDVTRPVTVARAGPEFKEFTAEGDPQAAARIAPMARVIAGPKL